MAELIIQSAQNKLVPDVDFPVDEEVDFMKPKCPKDKEVMVELQQSRIKLKPFEFMDENTPQVLHYTALHGTTSLTMMVPPFFWSSKTVGSLGQ